ncbi:MAG TPA: FtsX-like permease family protein, partial [Anaerolineales bacterium]|nr:FtsX-like permease family protein [Anaerolineales bacterium]
MEKLFGLDMNLIAAGLGSALAAVLAGLALLAWRGRVMFKLGLRPIPRRRVQSALIVFGLMLATLIITAAFVTGDTLSHTIRSLTVQDLGETDEWVRGSGEQGYFKIARFEQLSRELADYPLVDWIAPVVRGTVPVVNVTHRRSVSGLEVIGLRPEDASVLTPSDLAEARSAPLNLNDLAANEIYLNPAAAKALDAMPGDELKLYADPKPTTVFLRAIVPGGVNPRLILPLRRAQALFDQRGKINLISISNAGDVLMGADLSQEVTAHLRGLLTDPKVMRELFDLLTEDGTAAQALRRAATWGGNFQQDALALAAGLEAESLTPKVRSLLADQGLGEQLQTLLAEANWRGPAARDRLGWLFENLSEMVVDDVKWDNLDQAEQIASAFTAIFVVTGLFSIAAGMLLIFLIFVMLAAERKSEMGMTRAVGAQRRHLVEMFVFEGTAYDIAAAAVGVGLGVGVGLLIAMTLGQAFASEIDLTIQPHYTPRSLVISYSLGMLVTFATVVFSSYKVSRLNIVAAIRDLPEPPSPPTRLRDRLLAPLRIVARGFHELRRLRLRRALRSWMVEAPLSVLRMILAGFRGGPLTLLLGLAMLSAGLRASSSAGYGLGVSFTLIGGGLMARGLLNWLLKKRPGLGDRVAFTLMGGLLAIFWSLPFDAFGIKDLTTGPEMFFISGMLLVAGAVMVVMYNADLLLWAILRLLGGARHLAPVLRMAVAYPLASRFRTGLTVGMFAIVVFSVIFIATAFKTNEAFFANTDALTGGFDLRVGTSAANPVPDLAKAIAANPRLRRADYPVVAAQSHTFFDLRQSGDQWHGYPVTGGDAAYLESVSYDFAVMAEGYHSAAEVWRALRDRPGFAVIDRYAVLSRQTTSIIIGGPTFKLQGVYIEDETMPPITVEVRDPASKATFRVTIIGVLDSSTFIFGGLLTSQATLDAALPSPLALTTHYIRLAEGVDPESASRALESAFLKYGLQSVDQVAEIREQQKSQRVIEILLQGFLTLGLVVGVAALGVASTRAVVERRQQIGMLRALGFQKEMVGLSFLIEASFVALLGIGLGAVLALIPAYHMIMDTAEEVPGLQFQIPWDSMALTVGVAYGMALLMTWLPALQASRVMPAEALRYE